jgi:FkbM family methyltransferase
MQEKRKHSYKKTLIQLLDRPGGRFLLGRVATRFLRRTGYQVEILYRDGLWTRHTGLHFFPDSPSFEYEYDDFSKWENQVEIQIERTRDFWLQHYNPENGDTIVDVGAGRGEDMLPFSRGVGADGRVIAIEAHPVSFALLAHFCRLNRLSNATPLHFALMDTSGTVRISDSASGWMENAIESRGASTGIPVPARPFEALYEQEHLTDIAFLKMNIEGAERFALCGMESVMSRIRRICVACHDFRADLGHGEHFRTRAFVQQFLTRHGFDLKFRADDPRDYVRDHIFGEKRSAN